MTDINAKASKIYIKKSKTALWNKYGVKQKGIALLCILSFFTVKENMLFAALPLVFMQICTDKRSMYLCALASAVFYSTGFVHTAFFVPYAAFVLVFSVADFLLQQSRAKPLWFAAAVFLVSKLYLLSFGYQSIYWTAFAVEIAALALLPQTAGEGFAMLVTPKETLGQHQFVALAAALLLAAFALQGINSYPLELSVCFLLCMAFFYIIKDALPMALTAFVCLGTALCQDKNFAFLFAGFAVIFSLSVLLLKMGGKGYIFTVFAAAVVTAAFLSQFNSFVFLSASSASLAGCFVMCKVCVTTSPPLESEEIFTEDYLRLSEKIDKLNRCFSFLGNTVIDISNLLAADNAFADTADTVANQICRSCKNNTLCWQQHYSHTQSQFSSFAHSLQKGGAAAFDQLLLARCDKTEKLASCFEDANRLATAQRLMERSGSHSRRILQNQFLTMAQVLKDITYSNSRSGVVNTAITHTVNGWLAASGKRTNYCICYQNRARCVINTDDVFDGDLLHRLRLKLENLYGTKFAEPSKHTEDSSATYTYWEVPLFSAEYGTKSQSRYAVCGDVCRFFNSEGTAYAILADGMGTGSFAAAEAQTAVAMLENLLTSGVKVPVALEITNTALNLKGTGQSCVALDILQSDCYSGATVLYKAGGAATVIFDGEKIKTLSRESLPIGILKDIKTATFEFTLNNGDVVLLLSDGADADREMLYKIRLLKQKLTCSQIAAMVADDSSTPDDATAAAFRLTRT